MGRDSFGILRIRECLNGTAELYGAELYAELHVGFVERTRQLRATPRIV